MISFFKPNSEIIDIEAAAAPAVNADLEAQKAAEHVVMIA